MFFFEKAIKTIPTIYTGDIFDNLILDSQYSGSFHINLTLPHKLCIECQDIDYDKHYESIRMEHIKLMNYIILLQPLILGVFSLPQRFSFNEKDRFFYPKAGIKISELISFYQLTKYKIFIKIKNMQ